MLDLVQAAAARSAPAGTVLDRTALEGYRRRLAALSEERLRAEEDGDLGRLHAVEEEHDALASELRRDSGLGGRPRAFANHPAERARKAVTARIRDAIRRLDDVLPELGAHLDRSLVTGVQCRYRGEQRWEVRC